MKILNFSSTFLKTYLFDFRAYFFLILFLNFYINTIHAQLAHIDYPQMPADKNSALLVNFGSTQSSPLKNGIEIVGEALLSSQTGQISGIRATTSSNYSSQAGWTLGVLGNSKSYNGDGFFMGVNGASTATSISNSNGLYSKVVGGAFELLPSTNLSLGSGKYYIGGVLAEVKGTFTNTPSEGAVAAIMGIDLSSGTAQSWAAYLEGKNYLSDQTIIGRKNIPTQINLPDGTIDVSNYKLFVTGGIVAEEVLVALENLWADYVFEEDYDLKSLEQVEQFIEENGYLPAFPSALEIGKTGLKVGQITVLQQEKIEELFLHSIELNKQNKALKTENEQLKAQMAAFEKRLAALENE